MIKDCLNLHVKLDQLDISNGLLKQFNELYVVCGLYSPEKLESALLACSHYEHLHFCFIKCLEEIHQKEGTFNVFLLEKEYNFEIQEELMYLTDNIYERIKNID